MKTVEGTVVTSITTYVTIEVDENITHEQLHQEMTEAAMNCSASEIDTVVSLDEEDYGDSPTVIEKYNKSLVFPKAVREASLADGNTRLVIGPTSYTPAALGEIEDDYNEDLYPADNRGYARRVRQLEEAGMTTSGAQGVADAEWDATGGYRFGHHTGD